MTDLILLITGILLLILATGDMLSATFGTNGGFMARRISILAWAVAVKVFERFGESSKHKIIRTLGTGVCLTLLSFWIGCIIIGWALIFSHDGAMDHQGDKNSTDWVDHLQFSVSTLSGLGRGLWKSSSDVGWELSALFAGLMGTFVISFAISFLIPIIQAAKSKRVLAHRISSLAHSPVELLNRYVRDDSSALEDNLKQLIEPLTVCYQAHRSYPALHFMHSDRSFDALGLNLVILDEALTLMKHATPGRYNPPPSIFEPTRELLRQFFLELEHVYMLKWQGEKSEDLARSELLDPLEISDVDRAGYVSASLGEALQKRRRSAGTLLRNTGWRWEDVYGHIQMSETKPLNASVEVLSPKNDPAPSPVD